MKSPVVSVSNLSTLSLGIFVASILLAGAPAARAASETWIGLSGTTGNWGDIFNWSGQTAAPGSTSGTTSTDIATFNSAVSTGTWGGSAGDAIVINSTTQNIGGINFDTNAGSYFIGYTGSNSLFLTSGGTIQILSTFTGSGTETINAPLVIEGGASNGYTFSNNSVNGTLDFGGTIGGASGAGNLTLTLSGGNTNANTISGAIGNGSATSLALTKSGAGTWVLTGTNTYTGATTISAGTLTIGGAGQLGSTGTYAGTISNAGTFIYNSSAAQTLSGVISGAGALTDNGTGILTLTAYNTYTGGTVVNSGTLNLDDTGNNGTATVLGTITVNTGGTLLLGANNVLGYNSGVSTTTVYINGGTLINNIANATENQGYLTNFVMTGGTANSTNGADIDFDGSSYGITTNASSTTAQWSIPIYLRVAGSSMFFNTALGTTSNGIDLLVSGVIAQAASGYGILKTGAGTLELTAANTYSGTTTINGGTLQIGNGTTGSLSSGALTFAASGGTVNFDEANGTSQGMGALTFSAGDGTVQSTFGTSGTTTLTFSSLASRTAGATGNFVTSGGTNGTSNVIDLTGVSAGFINQGEFFGGGNYAWMNTTGGYVRGINYGTDAGSVTYAGGTSLTGTYVQTTGAVTAQTTGTFITLDDAGSNNVTLASGQTLTTNGILETGGSSNFSGGTGIEAASGAELVIRTNAASDALTISTPILADGASSLTKSGLGTLNLAAANPYTGATTVDAGTLDLTGTLAGGTAIAVNGGTFASTGSISGTGSITVNGGTFSEGSGASISGTTAITENGPGTFAQASGATISGASTVTVSSGLAILGGTNTYTGATSVTGTLQLVANSGNGGATAGGTNAALGASSALTLNNGGTLSLQSDKATTFSTGSFTFAGTTSILVNELTTGSNQTLTIANNVASNPGSNTTINVSSTSGDTLAFGSQFYNSQNGSSAFGGNSTTFNLTNANVFLNGISASDGGIVLNGTGSLTLSGNVNNASARTEFATVNSGTLILADTYAGSASGANWGILVTMAGGTLDLNTANAINNDDYSAHGNAAFVLTSGTLNNTSGTALTETTNPVVGINGNFSFGTVGGTGTNSLNLGTGNVILSTSPTITLLGSGTLTLGGPINSTANGITEAGPSTGILNLSGANTAYSGVTTLNGGTLQLGNANAIGTGALTINGGTLDSSVANLVNAGNNAQNWNASFGFAGTQNLNLGTGAVTLGASPTVTVTSGTLTVGGGIGGASYSITKAGPGTLVLNGSSTYGGGTTISAGTLQVGNSYALGGTTGSLTDNSTLNLNGNSVTIGAFSGSGIVTSTAAGAITFTVGASSNTTFSGVIQNGSATSVALTDQGSGTLTLTGSNTYTGGTTISNGTLQLGNGSSSNGYVNGNITDNATLAFSNPNSQSYGGSISGGGAVTKTGAGTLTLAGANSYNGATNINAGTLNLSGTYSGTGASTVSAATLNITGSSSSSSATYAINGGGTLTGTGFINGGVTVAGGTNAATQGTISMLNGTGGTLTLGGGLTLGSTVSGSSAILNFAEGTSYTNLLQLGASALTVNTGGAVINLTNLGGIASGQIYNLIDGSGLGLATGSGTSVDGLTIGTMPSIFGVSGYSLTVSSTAVQLSTSGQAAPSTAYWTGTVGGNGGTLASQWTGNNGTIGNFTTDSAGTMGVTALPAATTNVIFSAAGAGNFTNTLGQNFSINSLAFTGSNGSNAVTIAADGNLLTVGAGGVLVQSGAGPVTLAVNLAGAASVTANSTFLALLGTNSYTGGTVINSGTVQINSSTSLGASSGAVTMSPGTTLEALNAITDSHNFTLSGDPTIQVDSGIYQLTGVLADGTSPGTLEKSGTGTLTLAASETYSGATKINAGILQLGNGTTDGTLNTSGILDNSALVYDAVLTDTASYVISGSGSLTMSGAGTVILAGANTYGGATKVTTGTLQVGNGATGSLSGSTSVTLTGGSLVFDEANAGSFSGAIADAGTVVGAEGIGITDTLGGPISGTGGFTQTGAGTTTLAGANSYTGATAVSNGTLNLTGSLAGSNITTSGAAIFTEASTGAISGTGASFTQGSTGTSTLAGFNTYGGATTVSAGTLNLTGALAGSGISTSGAGVFTEASTGVISGTGGSFTQGSTGTSTLAGANTYSGATTINSGTLAFQGAAAVSGSSTLTVNNGGTLTLLSDVGATFTPGSVAGAGSTVFNGAANTINVANISNGVNQTLILGGTTQFNTNGAVLTVNGSNGYSLTLAAVALENNGGTQTFNPSAGATLNIGAMTGGLYAGQVYGVINLTGAGTTNLTGAITQNTANRSLAMTLNQTGTVTISGNNNFRNNNNASDNNNTYVNVDSGTTDFNNSNAISSSFALTLNLNGGTIDNTSGSALTLSRNGTTNIDGNFAFGGTGNLNLGTNAYSLGGSYTITTNGTATLTIGGAIASSTSSLTEAGTGTLNLSGANLYTGATTITGGTLLLGNQFAAQDSVVSINAGTGTTGTNNGLQFQSGLGTGDAFTIGGLSGASNEALLDTSGSAVALTVGNNNNTAAYSGILSGGGSLIKTGTGTQTLTGVNTYTGPTTISAGTLAIGGAGDLNSGSYVANISDLGTFNYNSSVAQTLSGAISGSGAIIESGAGTLTLTSSNSYSGGTAVNGGILNFVANALGTGPITFGGGTLQYAAGNTQDVSGQIGAGGGAVAIDTGANTVTFSSELGSGDTGGLAKYGTGTLDLSASNNYSGGTVINAGTVQINSAYSLGNPAGNVTINSPGTLEVLAGHTITTGRNFTLSGTSTVQVDGASSYTINGAFSDGAAAGSLNKAGTGALTLNGAFNNTGNVNVNAGTLIVAGSISGAAQVNVNSGGTLGGDGSIGASTPVDVTAGGTIAPGALTGTAGTVLTIGNNLTMAPTSTLSINLDGSNNSDYLSISGAMSIDSTDTLTLNILNPGSNTPETLTYVIALYGSETGQFNPSNIVVNGPATFDSINYDDPSAYPGGNDISVTLTLTAVPEPGTWGMLLSGAGMLVAIQRMRRRKF
jgi:autotransporter-associated beta strand protein